MQQRAARELEKAGGRLGGQIGAGIAGVAVGRKAKDLAARAAIRAVATTPVRGIAAAGAAAIGGTLAVALAAGVGAYLGTTKILSSIRNAKRRREEERALAADAYRVARLSAQEQLGRPLSAAEHRLLAAQFRAAIRGE